MTLTVGITTRDRPASLQRCLHSLQHLAHLSPEVLVFDDGSRLPAERQVVDVRGLRFIRADPPTGYIAGRNTLVDRATSDAVLLLDDDALLLDAHAVEAGLKVLSEDERIAAVAFAQAEQDGTRWPEPMQPARASAAALVPSFFGFAHLLRRDIFVRLGGYRARFEFYGEEKDYALRLLEAGYSVVYLPDALVAHAPDPAGRDTRRYLRFVTRNDCLNALYNEPLSRVLWLVPARMFLYFRMRRHWRIRDPWGWAWIAGEIAANLREVLAERRAVSRATIAEWQRLRTAPRPYRRTAP